MWSGETCLAESGSPRHFAGTNLRETGLSRWVSAGVGGPGGQVRKLLLQSGWLIPKIALDFKAGALRPRERHLPLPCPSWVTERLTQPHRERDKHTDKKA